MARTAHTPLIKPHRIAQTQVVLPHAHELLSDEGLLHGPALPHLLDAVQRLQYGVCMCDWCIIALVKVPVRAIGGSRQHA